MKFLSLIIAAMAVALAEAPLHAHHSFGGTYDVSKTITISYIPAGFSGTNQGTIGTIPDGTTLTFSVPPENTNFLEPTTGTNLSSDGNPFTYAYEFGTSKTTLEQQLSLALGHPFTTRRLSALTCGAATSARNATVGLARPSR